MLNNRKSFVAPIIHRRRIPARRWRIIQIICRITWIAWGDKSFINFYFRASRNIHLPIFQQMKVFKEKSIQLITKDWHAYNISHPAEKCNQKTICKNSSDGANPKSNPHASQSTDQITIKCCDQLFSFSSSNCFSHDFNSLFLDAFCIYYYSTRRCFLHRISRIFSKRNVCFNTSINYQKEYMYV